MPPKTMNGDYPLSVVCASSVKFRCLSRLQSELNSCRTYWEMQKNVLSINYTTCHCLYAKVTLSVVAETKQIESVFEHLGLVTLNFLSFDEKIRHCHQNS